VKFWKAVSQTGLLLLIFWRTHVIWLFYTSKPNKQTHSYTSSVFSIPTMLNGPQFRSKVPVFSSCNLKKTPRANLPSLDEWKVLAHLFRVHLDVHLWLLQHRCTPQWWFSFVLVQRWDMAFYEQCCSVFLEQSLDFYHPCWHVKVCQTLYILIM